MNENITLEDLIGFEDDREAQSSLSSSLRDVFGDDDDITKVEVIPESPNPSSEEADNLTTTEETTTEEDDDSETEVEEKKITPEKTTATIEDTEETPTDNSLQLYYDILQDGGILAVNEDFVFDGTVEGLQTAIEQTSSNLQTTVLNAVWNRLPPQWQPALQYALSGGTDVEKYLKTFQTKALEELDIKGSVDDQREVIKQYFKRTTKRDDDSIERMINKLQIMGELEEEATSSLKELKELDQAEREQLAEEARLAQVQAQQEQLEERNRLSTSVDSLDIEDARKSKLKAFMLNVSTTSNSDTPSTQFSKVINSIQNNKDHLVQLGEILLDYDPQKGFNLDRVEKKASSKAANQLQKKLQQLNSNTKTKVQGASSKILDSSNLDWEALMRQY